MLTDIGGGHYFKHGVCDCGRRLVDLRGLTEADVGKEGIAHTGKATIYEIQQIDALIAKMDAHFETILGWTKPNKE